ncbi:MAG TPA: tetratricopeptide repeat protein [Pyrinomonadaceae bacterium]|nr:tetratricopeptide repeat protein [Pyrinomonadaceae bacterium]
MKSAAPVLKTALLLFLLSLICADIAFAQRRGKAPRKSESRAAGLVDEADKMAEDKKWPEAIDAYKLAIRLDPNYAPAFGGLGDAYFNGGNWEQALVAYKEQVRLAPNDAQAQYDLGYFYNAIGRHGEAFAPLVKATSLDPSFAEAFYGIGYAYLRGADFEKSISFLKSAIRLKPDYGDAYYGLGQAYARLGKADLANEQLKKLNTVDPKLARKLEKELQTATADASSVQSKQTTPVSTARVVDTAPQTPSQTTEPVSRQLQQLPPPQTQSSPSSPASSTLSQADQVNAFPVSAKRWALVIGVDKYQDPQISPLKGSDNDARLIADALVRYAGFPRDQVILLSTDQPAERQPTRVNILRRLSNLSTAVPKDGLLLVSFAGHGMERSGQAFLLPSDAQISDQISFLEETAISMNRVKERIKETGVGQVVVLLDACRNDPGGRADAPNPLSSAYTNAFNFDVRNREVQAFATVYATGIGQRAYEYTEKKQGYFSWAVVEGLKGGAANDKGEITLSQLVKYVQDTVPKRIAIDLGSTKQQRPFAMIEGYRADELVVAVTNSASNAANANTPGMAMVDPAAIELSFWESIKNSTNPDDFKAYLDKYPDGQFAALAKSRAQPGRSAAPAVDANSMEMTYWNAIKDSRNPSDFRAYTTKFPNGLFVEIANGRVAMLEAEGREREKAKLSADEAERARSTHLFDVSDASRAAGTLTVTPGTLSFEPRKQDERKNLTVQCSEIKRVEPGQSAFVLPHVNIFLAPVNGKERQLLFYTGTPASGGLFSPVKPATNITADVINAIIEACRMARINK